MSDPMRTVLIVEDEADTRRLLKTSLEHEGYATIEVASGGRAIQTVRSDLVELVLLDLGLPDMNGADVIARMRMTSDVPIIVLSANVAPETKIDALDRGANDYVTKPFAPTEILARVRASLRVFESARRSTGGAHGAGELVLDAARHTVWRRDEEVCLTPHEYKLLDAMVRRAGRVVRHEELLRLVWGPEAASHVQYLRVYIRNLRSKLEPEPRRPRHLVTVPGVGYRLDLAWSP